MKLSKLTLQLYVNSKLLKATEESELINPELYQFAVESLQYLTTIGLILTLHLLLTVLYILLKAD